MQYIFLMLLIKHQVYGMSKILYMNICHGFFGIHRPSYGVGGVQTNRRNEFDKSIKGFFYQNRQEIKWAKQNGKNP